MYVVIPSTNSQGSELKMLRFRQTKLIINYNLTFQKTNGNNDKKKVPFKSYTKLLTNAHGLMVSALDSGTSSPGSGVGRGHKETLFSYIDSLSTQVYKGVLVNFILGWTSIPSRGSRNTPSRFMLHRNQG